jgi:hypothetical protein
MNIVSANITPYDIFSDLCDGDSVYDLADKLCLTDQDKAMTMAQNAISAFRKDSQTPQDQKDMHLVLNCIFDGYGASTIQSDFASHLDYDTAQAYCDIIGSDYTI